MNFETFFEGNVRLNFHSPSFVQSYPQADLEFDHLRLGSETVSFNVSCYHETKLSQISKEVQTLNFHFKDNYYENLSLRSPTNHDFKFEGEKIKAFHESQI